MGMFDETPFDKESKEKAQEELAEMMEAVVSQLGPMMEGLLESVLHVFEKEDLVNRMVWATATQTGKMREALEKNGFSREEAIIIISHQGNLLSSAMNSISHGK